MNKKTVVLLLSLIGINLFSCKKKEIKEIYDLGITMYYKCNYCGEVWEQVYAIFKEQKVVICDECAVLTFDLMLGRFKGDER